MLFCTDAGDATVWITEAGVTYQFFRRIERSDSSGRQTSTTAPYEASFDGNAFGLDARSDSVETMVIRAEFVGSNPNPEVVADGLLEYKCNYFLGNDPAKWRTDVPNFTAVTLRNVFNGVDLSFSAGTEGKLTYRYSVMPGADVSQIEVAYEGGADIAISTDGNTSAQTEWGEIRDLLATPVDDASKVLGTTLVTRASGRGTIERLQWLSRAVRLQLGWLTARILEAIWINPPRESRLTAPAALS